MFIFVPAESEEGSGVGDDSGDKYSDEGSGNDDYSRDDDDDQYYDDPEELDKGYAREEEILLMLGQYHPDELRPLGHQFSDMVLSCTYRGTRCGYVIHETATTQARPD